jgi:activator of HSP90 ATPase
MTKSLKQDKLFNLPSNKLYKFYMDEKIHSEITGEKAKIGENAGDTFSAFRGQIKGKLLHVKKNKLIVQTWRYKNWEKSDMDSIVTLTFNENEDGSTQVSLFQANIPEDHLDAVKQGWNNYYWKSWKKYINNSSGKASGQGRKTKESGTKRTGTKKRSKKIRSGNNITIA